MNLRQSFQVLDRRFHVYGCYTYWIYKGNGNRLQDDMRVGNAFNSDKKHGRFVFETAMDVYDRVMLMLPSGE
jgi:hypothetical protein